MRAPAGEEAREADRRGGARDESQLERLDRNTSELVQETRAIGTGVQVIFAFLLVVPFDSRFTSLSSFDRNVYFATLLCVAGALALIMAPSIHHRLLFGRGAKAYIVGMGNVSALAAALLLVAAFTGILVLISNVIFGTVMACVVGPCSGALLMTVWFLVPAARLRAAKGDGR